MNKAQIFAVGLFIGLTVLLYFGCDTKSSEHRTIEKSRAQKFELINVNRLVSESMDKIPGANRNDIMQLNGQLKLAETDSEKSEIYQKLASLWYASDKPLISGHYAEQIAQIENTDESWRIAGTTYSIAFQRSKEDNEKKHALMKSRAAFETAISMDAENIESQINLALTYVDAPLEDNPMKGILMLLDLNKAHPEDVSVLMQLGRLSMKTGQFQKAVDRFKKVIELRPSFAQANCLLADAYQANGQSALALEQKKLCDTH